MVNHNAFSPRLQRGTTMIEVLVTIVILTIGLLGLAGLQTRLQSSEMEAYQRAQALVLVNDMAERIATNRANAAAYVTGSDSPLGADMTCSTSTATQVDRDIGEWCDALQGASETATGNIRVGAVIGGRGCVEDLGNNEYLITVAWQGLTPISAPSPACGQGEYNGGTACTGDLCRRVITTVVRIGNLS
jgi:type IV pilus assembly protein PilV